MNCEGLVAVVASLLTMFVAVGLYRRQGSALDLQRRSLVDSQAHQVTAWADTLPIASYPPTDDNWVWHKITIENTGNEAVYGVRIVTIKADGQRIYGSPIAILAARSRHNTTALKDPNLAYLRFELSFMDSRRNHWVRRERGGLDKVPFPGDGSAIIIPTKGVSQVQQKEERPPAKY